MEEEDKCVVILSGGIDSSTVAYWAKAKGYEVHALTFRYGQIAQKEVEHAVTIATDLRVPIEVIDLDSLKQIFAGVTSLCDKSIEMTSAFSPQIIVPFRNAIFLSIAVAYAVSIGATKVFYGAQGSDATFYPDCRKEFYQSFEKTARLGASTTITIEAPFGELEKAEVIGRGSELGVPFRLTWSCYLSGAVHCGNCESCVNRRNAFEEAEIVDPTEYAT